jgi:hypothetical protein
MEVDGISALTSSPLFNTHVYERDAPISEQGTGRMNGPPSARSTSVQPRRTSPSRARLKIKSDGEPPVVSGRFIADFIHADKKFPRGDCEGEK